MIAIINNGIISDNALANFTNQNTDANVFIKNNIIDFTTIQDGLKSINDFLATYVPIYRSYGGILHISELNEHELNMLITYPFERIGVATIPSIRTEVYITVKKG